MSLMPFNPRPGPRAYAQPQMGLGSLLAGAAGMSRRRLSRRCNPARPAWVWL